jgi:hypothetical protein
LNNEAGWLKIRFFLDIPNIHPVISINADWRGAKSAKEEGEER